MRPVLLRTPLSKPPAGVQLDRSHPLGKDVLAAWMTLESGGKNLWSSAGKDYGSTFNGGVVWGPSRKLGAVGAQPAFGPVPEFDGTTGYINFTGIAGFGTLIGQPAHYTVSTWFMTTRSGTTRQPIFSDWDSGFSNESLAIQHNSNLSTNGNIWINRRTGQTADTGVNVVANRWYHVVQTFDRVTYKTYVDGVLRLATADTATSAGNKLALGRSGAATNIFLQGQIGPTMIYTRCLGASEAAWLHAEPFVMLRAPRVRIGEAA